MDKLDHLMRSYKKHGGKQWRKEQVSKIRTVLKFSNCNDLHQLGSRMIIQFYIHLRSQNRSYKTLMSYFYALKAGYEVLGRSSEPPRPRKF